MAMITLTDLEYAYPSGGVALSSMSMTVARGSLVGLVGANGSGKSTLLALLAGLYSPTHGQLVVDGHTSPGDEKSIRELSRLVMQDADIQILGATVEEDMLIGRGRDDESVQKSREVAALFHLQEYWERPVQSLSWGMKRKLCLATALLDNPSVLLLDEPFSGLDYSGKLEMRKLIVESRLSGLTQIVSSHDLECLVDIVDTLLVLEAGALVQIGEPSELLDTIESHGVRAPCSWRDGRKIVPWESV